MLPINRVLFIRFMCVPVQHSMDLPRAIVLEAQRLYEADQREQLMKVVCSAVVEIWNRRASRMVASDDARQVYLFQGKRRECIMALPGVEGSTMDCNDKTIAALAAQWGAWSSLGDHLQYRLSLYRHMDWDAEQNCFSHKRQLIQLWANQYVDHLGEDKCRVGLQHFANVVAALRPDMYAPSI